MPLPGGATDKFGNRYEGLWTVACMIRVIDEKADSIRLEPPGTEGEGVEFWLSRAGEREYHQVKRQQSASGRWTLADLENKKILSNFWEKLKNPTKACVFVSGHAAFQLDELADRARRSASWQEFHEEFLRAGISKDSAQFKNFQDLCTAWSGSSEEEAYEALKRTHVETISEQTLRTTVESYIAPLVEGETAAAIDTLAQYALDEIHRELKTHDIWQHLENRGFRRRQWNKDTHVWAAVDKVNHLYFSRFENEKVAGEIIFRDEVSVVIDKLLSFSSKRGVLLTGEAGVGKSGVIGQVVTTLRARWIPLIAFRVDRLEPTQSPKALGMQLEGLPGSPADVLAAISQRRECVLIIDQLDAVSEASGRNPWFFECVDKIIKQAQVNPNIHLLLACRKFDLENDSRLRRLTGQDSVFETVTVNCLSHETVRKVCQKLGLDTTRLNQKQLNLLSIPLHLSLLAEVAEDESIDVLDFRTAKDLYDHFWRYKQRVLEQRLARPVQWTKVIDVLCIYMSSQQKQSLSAPQEVIDDYAKDAEAMASEHVLNWQDNRISFFHEGFFDYAFARRFAARAQNLLSFLQSSEQHLFRRAQVRQIILHERDADFDRYLDNLKELLSNPAIRFHLKQTVCAALVLIDNPTEEEWEVLFAILSNPLMPLAREAWRLLNSSLAWFNFIDGLGIVEEWLGGENDEVINRTINLLSMMQGTIPDRVATLVKPYIGISEVWNNRLIYLIQRVSLGTARPIFDLLLQLFNSGTFDREEEEFIFISDGIWSIIYSLPKTRSDWSCEIIESYLKRLLELSISQGVSNPFKLKKGGSNNNGDSYSTITESANSDPESFVLRILPLMLEILNLNKEQDEELPWKDSIWTSLIGGISSNPNHIEYQLIIALENALAKLVELNSGILPEAIKQLRNSKFELSQYLLIRTYTAGRERFSDETIDYLCEQPSRLKASYSYQQYWAARNLLEAITPHCSYEKLEQLEAMLLDYYSGWERGAGIQYGYHGYAQFILLDGIVASRRSESISRRLAELYRKFNRQPEPRFRGMTPANLVPPAIPKSATEKMTDGQWLKAISKYCLSQQHYAEDRSLVSSGAILEFLEEQASKQPERFVKLLLKFPENTNSHYYDAVLRGVSKSEVAVDLRVVLKALQRCHQLPSRPCGDSISWLFQKLANKSWSLSALDIVICYALNDPDPEDEPRLIFITPGGSDYTDRLYTAGINSVRGSAMIAMASLIFADKDRTAYFLPALQQAVREPSIAVKSCVAEALVAVLNYDRDLAVNLFIKLCEAKDALLGTQPIEDFLYYALPTHLHELTPILEQMLNSNLARVIRAGARQACLSSINHKEPTSLFERCLSSSETYRLAAAEIFVANLRSNQSREFCEKRIIQLFADSNEKVREEAAKCFFKFEGDELGNYTDLVQAFVDSSAFKANCHDLIYALEKTTAKLPNVTCLVCEKFVDSFDSDTHTGSAADADIISELLIRVYSQSKEQALQSRCLDVVDRMAQFGAYGLDKALQQFER
ncbi:ATP-binding protein [Nodosilinea sp. LEGE 06152]|uniref:ATP-binding protein n=1 Tax=Nodosilinea sp. LEGE 06152 TaxID=2777966 RepID=UPI00187FC6FF|nr:ATP-binding protein [Nodosilinea sp. LEGE 06152]MBE9160078.1 ATP-binding protein [Nodosilinea sp. LEGE 06152]